ncbi:MAG: alanine racemase [Marmoricola sp.]|jgi:alanine racemase|nr:alanine racemase [Marmoricola sp.]
MSAAPVGVLTAGSRDVARGPHLTVDLAAIAANTRLFATRATGDLMAVVKADGFGHGAAAVARTALANGASSLGVTSLQEALSLRDLGLSAPLLSWLNPVDTDFATAVRRGVDLAVPGIEHLDRIALAAGLTGTAARIHLHLDTGMARDGAALSDWPRLCKAVQRAERRGLVQVVGVMGHLGCADDAWDPCNDRGRATFARGLHIAQAVGLDPQQRHLAATSATLLDPRTHYDLCRVGAGLVGIDLSRSADLRQPMTLTAPVVSVRSVEAGTQVGYGHTFTTTRPTTLALLPLGYADGIPRAVSGASVLLAGQRRPVVGRISMDQIVVDAGPAPVSAGDVAVVFGPGDHGEPTVTEWAQWASTIEHEVVAGLGPRITRSYV